ncbi:MAG: hypothetical protein WC829_04450 [Hyphomicrobium sp.]
MIVRIFTDEKESPLAMDDTGAVFEITNMFMWNGQGVIEVDSLDEAESVVIKLAEDKWLNLDISDKTPWKQELN